MSKHNGIIEIHTIENVGDNAGKMGLLTADFVHYLDCQQLKVWLPKSEYYKSDFGNYQFVKKSTHEIQEQGLVKDKVSGNIKMLFDTLCFSEGDYILEIEHPIEGKHCLHFQKHPECLIPEKLRHVEPPSTDDRMWELFW
jgi:hypothetical protein